MRYLRHVETGENRLVSDDDDKTFFALQDERLDNGRHAWVQTGAHDPAISEIEANGQNPRNGELSVADSALPGAGEIPGRKPVAVAAAASGEGGELSGDELQARAAELNVKGRSSMNADELRAAVAAAESR
jgi:hypothetical protein